MATEIAKSQNGYMTLTQYGSGKGVVALQISVGQRYVAIEPEEAKWLAKQLFAWSAKILQSKG